LIVYVQKHLGHWLFVSNKEDEKYCISKISLLI
jgi:hypothetical protein